MSANPKRSVWKLAVKATKASPILCAAFLSACSSLLPTTPYMEPNDGPRARVRFRTEIETVEILELAGDPCKNEERRIARLSHRAQPIGNKLIGMPSYKGGTAGTTTEVYVPAEKPLNLTTSGSSYTWLFTTRCDLAFSFQPKANEDYEVTFEHAPKLCIVSVARILPSSPEAYLREPVPLIKTDKGACRR